MKQQMSHVAETTKSYAAEMSRISHKVGTITSPIHEDLVERQSDNRRSVEKSITLTIKRPASGVEELRDIS